jgi:hypothetical protein
MKEYKIKEKHILKLNKLYEKVEKEVKEKVTLPMLVKSDKKENN